METSTTNAVATDEAFYRPNEDILWKAFDSCLVNIDQHKESLGQHLERSERTFDIICFKSDFRPLFESCYVRPRRKGGLEQNQEKAVITKLSDNQDTCILKEAQLMYPILHTRSWRYESIVPDCCGKPINRKELNNYRNTGFCTDHVNGTFLGSEEAWQENNFRTIRGFNVARKIGQAKFRHMLCIEGSEGMVFLKWCTQCHLWKNFNEFCVGVDGQEGTIETFCGRCQLRQKESRKKQLDKRREQRSKMIATGSHDLTGDNEVPQDSQVMSNMVGSGKLITHKYAPKTPDIQENLEVDGQDDGTTLMLPQIPPMEDEPAESNFVGQDMEDKSKKRKDMSKADAGIIETFADGALIVHPNDMPKKKKMSRYKRSMQSPETTKEMEDFQRNLLQSIEVEDYPFYHPNEDDFRLALPTAKVTKHQTLSEYLETDDRVGDIIYFSAINSPSFHQENNPIPKTGLLNLMNLQAHPSFRISNDQEFCINSLDRSLMTFKNGEWQLNEVTSARCEEVRNTPEAKKASENYKFSGFCVKCQKGEGLASEEAWHNTNHNSVRGFNLNRKKIDYRPRHFLCIEKDQNKVFLKWCTQCHTWKNFSSFLERNGGTISALNTFCAICHRRQQVSRKLNQHFKDKSPKPGPV